MRSLHQTLLLLFALLCLNASATAAKGTVAYKQGGCDYFIVESASGYHVLQWYGGHDVDRDDILVGDFRSYGMHVIYNKRADAKSRVWIDDYDLSKEDALEKLVEHCE